MIFTLQKFYFVVRKNARNVNFEPFLWSFWKSCPLFCQLEVTIPTHWLECTTKEHFVKQWQTHTHVCASIQQNLLYFIYNLKINWKSYCITIIIQPNLNLWNWYAFSSVNSNLNKGTGWIVDCSMYRGMNNIAHQFSNFS